MCVTCLCPAAPFELPDGSLLRVSRISVRSARYLFLSYTELRIAQVYHGTNMSELRAPPLTEPDFYFEQVAYSLDPAVRARAHAQAQPTPRAE